MPIINLMGGIITITMTGEGISMKIITKGKGEKGFHTMGNSSLDKWGIQTMVRIIQGNISIQEVDSLIIKGIEMVTLEISPRDITGE